MNQVVKKILIALFTAMITLLGYALYSRLQYKEALIEKKKVFNAIRLLDLNGKPFDAAQLKTNRPLIVVYFNSQCSECVNELKDLDASRDRFNGTNFLFISSEASEVLRAFAGSFQIAAQPGVYFTQIEEEEMLKQLGNLGVPHILVYNSRLTLEKEFLGQTKIEALVKYATEHFR